VNAFVACSNPALDRICGWNEGGDTIVIHDRNAFGEQALPLYFEQGFVPNFIRTLGLYGFCEVAPGACAAAEAVASGSEAVGTEFKHPLFVRSSPQDMALIGLAVRARLATRLPVQWASVARHCASAVCKRCDAVCKRLSGAPLRTAATPCRFLILTHLVRVPVRACAGRLLCAAV
jgi:HSF-type DNA-binding